MSSIFISIYPCHVCHISYIITIKRINIHIHIDRVRHFQKKKKYVRKFYLLLFTFLDFIFLLIKILLVNMDVNVFKASRQKKIKLTWKIQNKAWFSPKDHIVHFQLHLWWILQTSKVALKQFNSLNWFSLEKALKRDIFFLNSLKFIKIIFLPKLSFISSKLVLSIILFVETDL